MLDSNSQVCKILEKTKVTVLEFYEGTANVLKTYKWLNTLNQKLNYQIHN